MMVNMCLPYAFEVYHMLFSQLKNVAAENNIELNPKNGIGGS